MSSGQFSEAPSPTAAPPPEVSDHSEFEFVVGKRQIAGLVFLTMVLIALFAGGSYLLGRSAGPVAVPEPVIAEAAPAAPVAEIVVPEAPLFSTPMKGPVYIQLGAVEKGMATLLTHGVRKLGYTAFVAVGDKPTVFRVLVGPFKTAEDYDRAKAAFSDLGLDSFSRRYQEQ